MDQRNEKKIKGMNLVITILFLVLIFGISALSLAAPVKTFSKRENRFLAQMPDFTLKNLYSGKFTKDYETYMTDQFLFRDSWIGVKTISERLLQKSDINGVYFGSDGYFIERIDSTDVDEEQMRKNEARLVEFSKKYSEILGDQRVHVLLAPTAFEILKDKLPAFAVGFDQGIFLDRIKESLGDTMIDLRNVLNSHSSEYIYYRTDHHWTTLAAYYAYCEWAEGAGIEPLAMDKFAIQVASNDFYGTLYNKLNIKMKPDELRVFDQNLDVKVTYNKNFTMEGKPTEPTDSMYDYDRLGTDDQYTFYLRGNNSLVEIDTDVKNGRHLLIIKDSYAHCFAPFTANHFEKVSMIDFRYFNQPLSDYVKENNVTDVLVLYNVVNFVQDKNSYRFER